jgi:hypothetical protein
LRMGAKLAQRKYSSIEILLLKCKIMVRGRSSNKSGFADYDPVRARAEGRAPTGMDAETAALFADGFEGLQESETLVLLRNALLPKLLSCEIRLKDSGILKEANQWT